MHEKKMSYFKLPYQNGVLSSKAKERDHSNILSWRSGGSDSNQGSPDLLSLNSLKKDNSNFKDRSLCFSPRDSNQSQLRSNVTEIPSTLKNSFVIKRGKKLSKLRNHQISYSGEKSEFYRLREQKP
jgi:hypothetical protein